MTDDFDKLLKECTTPEHMGPKMMHPVPAVQCVDRVQFISHACRAKRVLSLGASGPMQTVINGSARQSYGIDKVDNKSESALTFQTCDFDQLDKGDRLPFSREEFDLVVAGEVLEHLSNPGRFLDVLRKSLWRKLIITVPNAYSAAGAKWISRGQENVNIDHVCWYSWRTMTTLLRRHKYIVTDWYWYNGKPLRAEGMVFCCTR